MIPEPATPLWAAVKSYYDSWPPDSEDNAQQLGQALGALSVTASNADGDLRANAQAVQADWRDEAGGVLTGKITANARTWATIGQNADKLAHTAADYADDLIRVKETICATIAENEQQYEILRISRPELAAPLAAGIADILRQLVGGPKPASTSSPSLFDRLGSLADRAFNDAWTATFGSDTAGPTIGVGGNIPGLGAGVSASLVRDKNGNFYFVNSVSGAGATPEPGLFGGVGITHSSATDAHDMGGMSVHAGGSGGDVLGAGGSLDVSSSSTSETGLVGASTPGAEAEAGLSYSHVVPVSLSSIVSEGSMVGSLLTLNPVPLAIDSLFGK